MLNLIDMENWERKEFYDHYMNNVVCTYSLTANLDITSIKNEQLYPAMLWLLTQTVNDMKEFRTALTPEGVGVFESMHPSYTIFNSENKNFSVIWTEYDADYTVFLARYKADLSKYKTSTQLAPKEHKPLNTFDVSMLPWVSFSSFNLNVYNSGKYLLPIFTMGKTFTDAENTKLPIAMQVHHAVCDGYHISVFIEKLQEKINHFGL
jgi:chloramphenicol O-acetyltransferase type A